MRDTSHPGSGRAASDGDVSNCLPRTCPDTDRRRVLLGVGGVGVIVLAGCLDDDADDAEVPSHDVLFTEDGDEFEVSVDENEALLYPALDAGVEIPYSCEAGFCGECTVKYDGDANDVVVHDGNEYLDADQVEAGWVLTCVAYPRDDTELEVAHPDET